MHIVLAQINSHIGNFDSNTKKIVDAIDEAKKQKADLIIFPEMVICGQPPLDMLENKLFIEANLNAVKTICNKTTNITAIVGAVSLADTQLGNKLHNTAYIIENGLVKELVHKRQLSNDNLFNENRYFAPGTGTKLINIKGVAVAVSIGDDLIYDFQSAAVEPTVVKRWKETPQWDKTAQPNIIVNISAYPYCYHDNKTRQNLLKSISAKYNIPLINVNTIGANCETIFAGKSVVIDENNNIHIELKSFSPDFQTYITNTELKSTASTQLQLSYIDNIKQALILGISDFFLKNKFSKAVMGLSGGIDSAVVTALAVEALGSNNVTVLLMPSQYSSEHSITDSIQLCDNLNIKYYIIPIGDIYDKSCELMHHLFHKLPFGIAEENLQSRLRGVLLMAYSNKFNSIVLNCSNKSELAVGYSTMYGDLNGALSVIGDIYKTDIYKLAKHLNSSDEIIPENIITKPPSAELRPDQKDSDTLPEYEILDKILYCYIDKQLTRDEIIAQGFNDIIVNSVINMVNRAEYKRFQAPPILKLSSRSLGRDRQQPIVAIQQ